MTDQQQIADLRQAFSRRFTAHETLVRVFRAPGRTNLIGEHTDYNDGFVLPAAIDRATWIAIALRRDHVLKIHSEHFNETIEFNLDDTAAAPRHHWSDYVRGVAVMLRVAGCKLVGADMGIRSDVPLGAGLSSSASLEVATAMALTALADREMAKLEIARLCQKAENEFVGAHVGIMDQFVACFGQTGHAIFLDCRTMEHAAVQLPNDVRLVLCNTMVKHDIAAGAYNSRRGDCAEAVARLENVIPGIRELRDVTPDLLQQHSRWLPDLILRRARHVVTENERVLAARTALESGDLARLGELMRKSQASLRDDYEVSCKELDLMADLAGGFDGCFGARMTGGGFGGCTINLVRADRVDAFVNYMAGEYGLATEIVPEIYSCSAADGATELV